MPLTERGFMQYRHSLLCCLTRLLKQNSNSYVYYIFCCLYCMKPVLEADMSLYKGYCVNHLSVFCQRVGGVLV